MKHFYFQLKCDIRGVKYTGQATLRMDSRENQGTKVTDCVNIDKAQLPDRDLSTKIKRKLKNTPPLSSVSHQIQLDESNKISNEELLKYMSNLPSYLDKSDNLRERALSFGVLDWKRLETWQHNHRKTFSPSRSNSSLYFSTDISSTLSSRGRSCSPDETEAKKLGESQNLKEKRDKTAKLEYSLYGKYQSFIKLQENKVKECERDDIEVKSIQKTKTRNGKSTSQVEELGNLISGINRNLAERSKHKLLNRDFESNHSVGVKQASSSLSESFETPSHSSEILRNASPNRMPSIGLPSFSRRSNSIDLTSEPVQSKTQPKKDLHFSSSEIPKLRNPSPTRRFGIGVNRFSQRPSSVDISNVPQMSSQHDPYISQSEKDVSFSLENSNNDKLNVVRKSQRSPLRRLFDPILKPKYSEEDSEKLYLRRCMQSNEKHKPSTVHALIQLSIKNGLPLFTFADDNNSGVLAATMKKIRHSREGESSWIFTFFNIDEVKKKSGWMNKGCKSETHGYFPSVIAQMRVSDITHDTREFVSFSIDVSDKDRKRSNFPSKDEMVGILVNFSKGSFLCNKVKKGSDNSFSDRLFSLTAILPGGSHGVPIKGKFSSLIERWKSGGSCDCGGWDLGCRLKVITSQAGFNGKSKFCDTFQAAERFELFPQGEETYKQPAFVLSPFNDNAYSVEFDSSLSFLQAFSVGISILSSRKPCNLFELGKLFERKTEKIIVADDAKKTPNPPLSPIGRV